MNADVKAVLALARGRPLAALPASWPTALAIATRERCAALAWHRSGSEIRRLAPPEIVTGWRREALAALDLAALWEAVLTDTLSALRHVGVEPIVLKGLPLGQKLYGTTGARPSADLDLFIDADRRGFAHRALLEAGWRWRGGEAPFEGGYEAAHRGRTVLLEVHSGLLDDALVRHLPFAVPGARAVRIGAIDALAHDDDQLAAFLAVHLAKHTTPPLLWLIDFGELWEQLGADGRRRARDAARASRATRYLDWAVQRSLLIAQAADGRDSALIALGIRDAKRSDVHSALRVAALAANPRDVVAVFAAWVVPSELRANPARALVRLAQRLGKFIRGRRRAPRELAPASITTHTPVDAAPRALTLEARDFGEFARELAARDCEFWIRASGSSMHPSIPNGADVRLVPVRGKPIVPGDVVLADLGGGRIVLHRVRRVATGAVSLRGDANVRLDRTVAVSEIIARAEAVRLDGRVVPVPPLRVTAVRGSLRGLASRVDVARRLVRAATRARTPRGAAHAE